MLARKPSYFILSTADVIGEKFTRISHCEAPQKFLEVGKPTSSTTASSCCWGAGKLFSKSSPCKKIGCKLTSKSRGMPREAPDRFSEEFGGDSGGGAEKGKEELIPIERSSAQEISAEIDEGDLNNGDRAHNEYKGGIF